MTDETLVARLRLLASKSPHERYVDQVDVAMFQAADALSALTAERDEARAEQAEWKSHASHWMERGQAAEARIQDLSAWQSIETAPKGRGSILVRCPERQNTYVVVWADIDAWGEPGWFHFGGGAGWRLIEEPTHWRPLPDPPASEVKS